MQLPFIDQSKIAGLYLGEHFTGKIFPHFFKKRIGNFDHRLLANLKNSPLGKKIPLDSVSGIEPVEFKIHYARPQIPLLIKGMASEWPAVTTWNFGFFRERYGKNKVPKNNLSPTSYSEKKSFPVTTLADLLNPAHIEKHRLSFTETLIRSPELMAALDQNALKRYCPKISLLNDIRIFMAGKSFFTPIHAEIFGSLFVQIYGRKKWRLYRSTDYPLLQPNLDRRYFMLTEAQPEKNPPEKYPLIQYADYYEVTLDPGDVLWVPPYTWHQVSNQSAAIGVGYKYTSFLAAWRSSPLLTTLNLFAVNPPLPLRLLQSALSPKTSVLR